MRANKMNVLLIGASGFIGKNFIIHSPPSWRIYGIYRSNAHFEHFAPPFTNLEPVKCSLRDGPEVAHTLSTLPGYFDIGLFVWGNSDIGYSCQEPLADLEDNVVSLVNLLSELRFGKFVFMSSGTVYLGQEGQVDPRKPLHPATPYAINKLVSELYVRFFAEKTTHLRQYVNLRCFGAYGPMEPSRKIFTNLIKRFAIETRNDFTLTGDGTNLIDAMYIDDLIIALTKIIESNAVNLTVDLCKGEPMTLNQLVYRAATLFGVRNLHVKHSGESKEFIKFHASAQSASQHFGFKATTSLEEGLSRFRNYLLRETEHV